MKSTVAKKNRYKALLAVMPLLVLLIAAMSCSKTQKIQVILLSIDTLRGDGLSVYGNPRQTTPNLDQLTEDSSYFPEAYTNGFWTYPSHVSMLTGTLPSRHGVNQDWNTLVIKKKVPKLNPSVSNIAQMLKSENPDIKTIKYAKLPDAIGIGRGFDVNVHSDPFKNENRLKEMLEHIRANKENNFFMFMHTWMVHSPYANTRYIEKERINDDVRRFIDDFRLPPKNQEEKKKKNEKYLVNFMKTHGLYNPEDCRALYDGGVNYVDRMIGKMLAEIKSLNLYDNLMIIVVSDHGEHFAEHYPRMFYGFHGQDAYEEFIKVPIIIKYPGQRHKGSLKHPVSLIDLVPSILDYFNIQVPDYVQGQSLLTAHEEKKYDFFISESTVNPLKERKMIRMGDMKYIVTMKKARGPARLNWKKVTQRRLFNLKTDPGEKINLFPKRKFRALGLKLEKMLKKILNQSASTNRNTRSVPLDKETIEHMKSLGYL